MKHLRTTISSTLLLLGLLASAGVTAQTVNSTVSARSTNPVAGQPKDLAGDMANADLAKQGISNPTPTQLAAARQSVLDQRAKGMGWGQIANALGLNLGKVISAAARERKEGRQQTPQGASKNDTPSSRKNADAPSSASKSSNQGGAHSASGSSGPSGSSGSSQGGGSGSQGGGGGGRGK